MTITHILFDLYGTLADSAKMIPGYAQQLGHILSERYGNEAAAWTVANLKIVADWDSYYADLDLEGDHGIADMWEGLLRTTRALFRLTNTPEPPLSELTALSRELPYLASQGCDALYPETREIIQTLHGAGYTLGIASHAITGQIRGTLAGAGILDLFSGPLLGPDATGHFAKNRAYYLSAGLNAETCLVVDDSLDGMRGARAAGMKTVFLHRQGDAQPATADPRLVGDLRELWRILETDAAI